MNLSVYPIDTHIYTDGQSDLLKQMSIFSLQGDMMKMYIEHEYICIPYRYAHYTDGQSDL